MEAVWVAAKMRSLPIAASALALETISRDKAARANDCEGSPVIPGADPKQT